MSLDGWIDARDSESVEREWETLGAMRVDVGEGSPRTLTIRPEGAALLPRRQLDLCRHDCVESWAIREETDGPRGVQHITLDCSWEEFTRDGGEGRSITIIRAFDRAARRAVSIPLHHTVAWVVGEVDLSPLHLFEARTSFKLPWRAYDSESVRDFIARFTADLDARLATCGTWPGAVTKDEVIDDREYGFRVRRRLDRYESTPFSIELDELRDPDAEPGTGSTTVKLCGLPWGQKVERRVGCTRDPEFGVDGWIDLRLPRSQLDATNARIRAIPGLEL